MKIINRGYCKLFLILFLFIGIFLLTAQAGLDYKPPPQESIPIENPQIPDLPQSFSILIWNIGYCGLGEEADFFMDGGKMSLSQDKATVEKHFKNITQFIRSQDADLVLLQEVDEDAKRSYGIKQLEGLREEFTNYSSGFAYNYKVPFVPVPLKKPMGRVKSGLLTLSKFKITKLTRYTLPGEYGWPTRVFHLDRCILVSRFPAPDSNKECIIINMHLSAFDQGGEIRKKQLKFLKEFILKEYQLGNYVIVCGDWNHSFPGFKNTFSNNKSDPDWLQYLPEDWTPEGWSFIYDKDHPTIRANSTPYVKGDNFRTIIDGFLISPNVNVTKVQGFNLEFKDTDHNPVLLEVSLQKQEFEELSLPPEEFEESPPVIDHIPDCRTKEDIDEFNGNTVTLFGIYRISNEKYDKENHRKVFLGTYLELEDGTKVILSYTPPESTEFKDKKVKIVGIIHKGIAPKEEHIQRVISPHLTDYSEIRIIE